MNIIILAALFIAFLSPFFGGESFFHFIDFSGIESQIFWQLRLPRAILGFFVGAALGFSGAIFQTIFKNPLASPYTLGVATASSFGACLAIVLGFQNEMFLNAIIFSVITSFILLSYRGSTSEILLVGVALGLLFSSASIFISYIADPMKNYQLTRWLMGGLDAVSNKNILYLVFLVIFAFVYSISKSSEFDLLLMGDELAISKGLDVNKFKNKVIFILSLLIGVVVSFAGPIGFIGILVPHLCRYLGYTTHLNLLSLVFFLSGSLLVFCDFLARTTVFPAEIPVGVITALIGSPLFIFVLMRKNC